MKKNNGFSLVELIIVIAIMAILVGILAPNLMRNIEKSRVSKDKTQVDNIATAFAAAVADPDAYDALTTLPAGDKASNYAAWGDDAWDDEAKAALKDMLTGKFASKPEKNQSAGDCLVTIGDDNSVKVESPKGSISVSK